MTGLAISTASLARSYGKVRAVDGLDLRVPEGSIYGFLGPNGAGKTTTIRMLLGLVRPDAGEVRVFDTFLSSKTKRDLLRRIGAMVETPSLYPHLTGRENLRVTQGLLGLPTASVDRALRTVNLHRDADRLVSGYSLGMRQRLGLAMALLNEPKLLILDEPTNGLDPAGISEIRDLLRTLRSERGVTVFLSSHLLSEVEQVASHVGIIGRGRLLFQGSLAELQSQQEERAIVEVDSPDAAILALHRRGWRICHQDGTRLSVDLASREEVPRLAADLLEAGLRFYQIASEQPTLEELFLNLTRSSELGR